MSGQTLPPDSETIAPPLHPLQVVGMGLDGLTGLTPESRHRVEQAKAIAGSPRLLQQVGEHPAEKIVLGQDLIREFGTLQERLEQGPVVVLASGDPLFFGIGRLLTEYFPADCLQFYPHISSVQLAFSRLRMPWQLASVVSVHGRSPDRLHPLLKQGASPIAVLTDGVYTPGAIAQYLLDVRVPETYRMWVCSELGSSQERVQCLALEDATHRLFPLLSVVVLERIPSSEPSESPLFGIPDEAFYTFADQPGLITKQEVRMLTLGLLGLRSPVTVWDIGAGTGSISVEIGRLVPEAQVFAIEQSATGLILIQQNCDRFAVSNVTPIAGAAPQVLDFLPDPDRIVLGGGGANLEDILGVCHKRLKPGGIVVGNFATLETCLLAQGYWRSHHWSVQLLQVNLARSTNLPTLQERAATRFVPLNPVILLQARKPEL